MKKVSPIWVIASVQFVVLGRNQKKNFKFLEIYLFLQKAVDFFGSTTLRSPHDDTKIYKKKNNLNEKLTNRFSSEYVDSFVVSVTITLVIGTVKFSDCSIDCSISPDFLPLSLFSIFDLTRLITLEIFPSLSKSENLL